MDAFAPDLVFPLMDLSVEANALGRYTIFPREESATVPKDDFTLADLDRLEGINITFDSRLMGFVETVRMMSVSLPTGTLAGAYVVGPFTLAGLMMGADDDSDVHGARSSRNSTGCATSPPSGSRSTCSSCSPREPTSICILEPTAVMLSPRQFEEFSALYVRHITKSFTYSRASFVYHTCGNTMHLVESMGKAGVQGVSLDSPDCGVDLRGGRIPRERGRRCHREYQPGHDHEVRYP